MPNILYRTELKHTKRVWYTGSDALLDGYAVCYDRDTITATSPAAWPTGCTATTLSATYSSWGRHAWVEKPASGNLHNFAGVVKGNYAACSTGQAIDIILPCGQAVDVYTDAAALTMGTNLVTIQPGSYAFGHEGEGLIVGQYIQTISAAGMVQCVLWGVNQSDILYGLSAPSSTVRTPSAAIWETCPWNYIQSGRLPGVTFFTDFNGNFTLANGQTLTRLADGVSGCTAATTPTLSTDPGAPFGLLKMFSSTDNEDAIIQVGGAGSAPFIVSSAYRLWMECRVKHTLVTDTKHGAFIGFAEEALGATTAVVEADGTMPDKDYFGFHRLEGDGDRYDTVHDTAGGGGAVTIQADAVVIATDTWQNIGLRCTDGAEMYFYNNNTATTTSVTIADAEFPDGEEMSFYAAIMNASNDDASMYLDWVRIACMAI